MDHLLRAHAPITAAGWELIDGEATQRLRPALAARRLADFAGPRGWSHSATNLGRTEPLASVAGDGVTALRRRVLPLVEARADFEISFDELRDADRGAADADLDALDLAAHRIAVAENVAVFHGWSGAITGITEASPHAPVPLGASPQEYPSAVAAAIERLLGSGIAGPYALALGAEQHRLVIETAEHGGYPMLEHLRKILDGPIVWARASAGLCSSASAAATSCSTAGRICRSATTPTTSRSCACICRRASASRSRRRTRPWRSSATRLEHQHQQQQQQQQLSS